MVKVTANAKLKETSNSSSRREIRRGEIPNPPSPRSSESSVSMAKTKRRKIQNEGGESFNPTPPQKETEGGETSNPSSQREIGGREPPNSASSREIGGEETSNPPHTGGREEIRVTIDPDLLDCSICTYPLCPPLYQCLKGHVACFSCWLKLQNECPTCGDPIGSRIIALEAVLESIHLPCIYFYLGCRKFVSYSQRQVHADTCESGLSLCPIPGCGHKASPGEWRAHFLKDHQTPSNYYSYYRYGESFTILFKKEDLYYTIFGPGEDMFLLVKEANLSVGNALSLYYIDPKCCQGTYVGQYVFPYELEVVNRDNCIISSMQRKSKAVSIKEWKRGEVHDFPLFLPLGYSSQSTKVRVLINKELDVDGDDVFLG